MAESERIALHIPDGINFECSGCGNCCFSWPVPLTGNDVERLGKLVGPESLSLRKLPVSNDNGAHYTHSLEKRPDGRCAYLTQDNRCSLHADFGAEAKPSMCRLFPYTFTPTPSGVYASLSFASTAVLQNGGRPLNEQTETIERQWRLFRELMPNHAPDWNSIQIADGMPISWQEYLRIEEQMLPLFHPNSTAAIDSFLKCATDANAMCTRLIPPSYDLERNLTDARPKTVDQILLKYLLEHYFPRDVFGVTSFDLPAREIAQQLVVPPNKVRIYSDEFEIAVPTLLEERLGDLNSECENLLRRFVYNRIFAKLYFGPGFNNLSVLSGVNHLLILICLIRIKLKAARVGPSGPAQIERVAELVRTLERRLTVTRLSRESGTILEVLLASPSRLQRILSFAA